MKSFSIIIKDFIETSAVMEMEEITRMKSREEFTAIIRLEKVKF
jgi:hypothetical protein